MKLSTATASDPACALPQAGAFVDDGGPPGPFPAPARAPGRAAGLASALAAVAVLAGCASAQTPPPPPPTDMAVIGEARHHSGVARGLMNGYLEPDQRPDSLALLPAPPALGTLGQAADEAVYRSTRPLLATARGRLATADARLNLPEAAEAFSCAADLDITQATTPHLLTLLRRSLADAGLATYGAKDHYQRTRPFAHFKEPSCTPEGEARYAKDGSYPSGHTALGWSWALILTELMPERSGQLLKRGYDYGQSRVICAMHWQSDVDAGRVLGSAAVARLHADPVFRAQMGEAAREIKALRAANRGSSRDCRAEAEALAIRP